MEICKRCHQHVSFGHLNEGICHNCESMTNETVQKLQARIAELEKELQMHKATAEKRENLMQLTRGDDFNNEFLF